MGKGFTQITSRALRANPRWRPSRRREFVLAIGTHQTADKPASEKRKPRIGALDTVQGVRRELGRIYRLARYGDLDTDHLRAFTYCLKELRECLAAGDFERRISELEAGVDGAEYIPGGTPKRERTLQ